MATGWKSFYNHKSADEPIEVVQEQKTPDGFPSGFCQKCGYGRFSLKVNKGAIYRKCKACDADQPEIT